MLTSAKYDAVIPYTQITDTLKIKNKRNYKTVDRDKFVNTQTPQGIKIKSLLIKSFNFFLMSNHISLSNKHSRYQLNQNQF